MGDTTLERLTVEETGSLVNLRGCPEDPDLAAAVEAVLGLPLPGANRWSGDPARALLWLGPDEWLIVAPPGEAGDLESRLRQAVGDDPWLSLVDVSHNYTRFQLAGPAARDALSKGCPLDLHVRAFGPGQCAQSVLAGTRVLLRALADDHLECWVRNSFARYAAAWLDDALAEFSE